MAFTADVLLWWWFWVACVRCAVLVEDRVG